MDKMSGFINSNCYWIVAHNVVRKLYHICKKSGNSAIGEEISVLHIVISCSAKLERLIGFMCNKQEQKTGLLRPHINEGRLHGLRGPDNESKGKLMSWPKSCDLKNCK